MCYPPSTIRIPSTRLECSHYHVMLMCDRRRGLSLHSEDLIVCMATLKYIFLSLSSSLSCPQKEDVSVNWGNFRLRGDLVQVQILTQKILKQNHDWIVFQGYNKNKMMNSIFIKIDRLIEKNRCPKSLRSPKSPRFTVIFSLVPDFT